ncbi:MAG: glycosyltransferase family 39 protein, partial [Chloroflexi bacterium]|nr:glycosyltransferase family 39 protein [Chloroflexota bacterium]
MSKSVLTTSILAVAVVALVIYYPATKIGFVNNDWIYLDSVARWNPQLYFYRFFVPGVWNTWYRPIFGLYIWIMFVAFGPSPSPFHLGYVILHVFNGLLVFTLVKRVSANLPLASIAALLWVGFPAYSKAVFWMSTPDTIEMFFYLGSAVFWLDFLQNGKRIHFLLAFVTFLLALMTKETSVTLPVILFLVDRILIRDSIEWRGLVRRYLPFLLVWAPYLLMEYLVNAGNSYVGFAGYGFGVHVFWNLLNSLATLICPWRSDPPFTYVLATVIIVLFVVLTLVRKSAVLALLGTLVILNLLPVIGFSAQWFEMRYLYGAAIAMSVIFAAVLAGGWNPLRYQKSHMLLASAVVGLALVVNGTSVGEAIAGWGEIARQRATPFRDIEQSHPTFPNPTKLYFIYSPMVSVYDLSVMFLLHYGANITVGGT